MKKFSLSAVLIIIIAVFTASAQTGESSTNMKSVEFVLARATVSQEHLSLMDKIQRETEDLIVTIAPSPLLSLAHLIDQKMDASKGKKAEKRRNSKKNQVTVQM